LKFAAIFVLFANAFSAGMMFLASVFISRYGGKDLFGFFSVVLGVVVIGAKVATLGLDVAIVRFLPEYRFKKLANVSAGMQRFSLLIAFLVSCIGAVAFAILLHFMRGYATGTAMAAALCLPMAAILAVLQSVIRADANVSRAVVGEAIVRPVCFAVGLLFAYFSLLGQLTQSGVAISYLIALSVAVLVAAELVRRGKHIHWQERFHVTRAQISVWMGHGFNLLLSESATAVINQAPIVLAGLLLSASEAGEMSAVIRLAMLVIFALTAVQSVITPFLSRAMSRENQSELQALVARASGFTMLVALPVCGVFIVFSSEFMSFFGEGYESAGPLLQIMLIGYLIYAAAGPASGLLTMTGQHAIARKVICCAAVMMIIGAGAAIQIFGLRAGVWVSAVVIGGYPIFLAHFCKKLLGVDPTILSVRFLFR
tara:strand:- start:33604 stop:34884 length:1281 start_codon:yes stop_codon:yes gene_type:complete